MQVWHPIAPSLCAQCGAWATVYPRRSGPFAHCKQKTLRIAVTRYGRHEFAPVNFVQAQRIRETTQWQASTNTLTPIRNRAQAHLQPAETPSERAARQHVEALAYVNGKERRPKKNFLPEPGPGDRATTADILRAQRNNMPAIEFHQRQAAAAERTRE